MSSDETSNLVESETKFDVITDPSPVPNLDDAKTLKKLKRMEQLKSARESKKAKQEAKKKQDDEVRTALIELRAENQQLRQKRKRDDNETTELKTPAPKRPVRVTREPESEDMEEESPSFAREALKIGIVGGLGLISFLVQQKLAQPKPRSVAIPPIKKKQEKKASTIKSVRSNVQNVPIFGRTKVQHKSVGLSGFKI